MKPFQPADVYIYICVHVCLEMIVQHKRVSACSLTRMSLRGCEFVQSNLGLSLE